MTTTHTTLIIVGATGDLSARLLLPALGQLLTREQDRSVTLIGAGTEEWTDEKWRAVIADSFGDQCGQTARAVQAQSEYVRADITTPEAWKGLFEGREGRIAVYFAVPPAVAERACEILASMSVPDSLVLALEKPFGTDEASAKKLNATLARIVPESQVFRIDHFLGRSTLLNVLGLRFANRMFEKMWSAESIDSVIIRYDEQLGLEGRAGYYDSAGALVDMIQSHLLQVLAIIAMEAPASLDEKDFRAQTTAVLRATRVWNDEAAASSLRARYTAGTVDGRALPDYTDEQGVDPSRETETLAQVTFEVRNARWNGVPFILRSGKALAERTREIVLSFTPVPYLPTGFTGDAPGSVMRISLGPDDVELTVNVNGRDDPFDLERSTFSAPLGEGSLLAYGEVLSGILDAEPLLSVRGDAAEECWRIVAPVLEAWRNAIVPLEEYAAGSEGPTEWPLLPA